MRALGLGPEEVVSNMIDLYVFYSALLLLKYNGSLVSYSSSSGSHSSLRVLGAKWPVNEGKGRPSVVINAWGRFM